MALMLKADGKVLSDNRTGAGDDETITVDTTKVPAEVQEIVVLVNIHDAKNRQQNFGMPK